MSFKEEVFKAVKSIPEGELRTYKEIAKAIGRPHSYRAVGNALNTNYDETIPCHRVIRSDGKLGGYNRGTAQKKQRLLLEKAQGIQ